MAQEDQGQNWSKSGGRGRRGGHRGCGRPRKGAGIVPLEELLNEQIEISRIETEQRLKAAAAAAISPPSSLSPSMSHIPQQFPRFNYPYQPCMSIKNFPNESNPPSNWTPRTQQYRRPSSSSMVNVPSRYSKDSPSKQNNSNSFVPRMEMPVYEPMINQKRPRLESSNPFSIGVPRPPAFSFGFKWTATIINMKANGITSRAYGTGLNVGGASSAIRRVPSRSTIPSSTEPNYKRNENLKRNFLFLAPPTSASKSKPKPNSKSNSKSKSTSTFPSVDYYGLPPPSQGTKEEAQSDITTDSSEGDNFSGESSNSDLNL